MTLSKLSSNILLAPCRDPVGSDSGRDGGQCQVKLSTTPLLSSTLDFKQMESFRDSENSEAETKTDKDERPSYSIFELGLQVVTT